MASMWGGSREARLQGGEGFCWLALRDDGGLGGAGGDRRASCGEAQADATFAEIDTDGDGFLSRAEVIADITKRGGTEEQANATFDKLDTDKDGKSRRRNFRNAFGA